MEKLVLTGLSHPVTFELEPGFNTLGRNPTNDFRIHDATVSSFHCEIVRSEKSVVVRDLGSTNGTYVDGERIEEGALSPGQSLRVGNAELRLEVRSEPQAARISIPKVTPEPVLEPTVLADGFPACLNHSEVHAAYRCTRCRMNFCPDCVHRLALSGGSTRVLCPSCSGLCESLPLPPGVSPVPVTKKKGSFFGRLTETIRIKFK